METTTNAPCTVCGCTQSNLVDGFYYCVECGTQDTNVRETLVEFASLGDGVFAVGARKRVTLVPEAQKEQMTDDWYRWHSMNFLLRGLVSELVECGAAPSVRTKLLWVWVRYMKKYQNKADFGLEDNPDEENSAEEENPAMKEKELSFDEEEGEEEVLRKFSKRYYYDIKHMSMCLVITFLYVALNLDKSHIQLTHLIRFIREGRISVMHWQKYVPEELRPKKLRYCLLFSLNWLKYSYKTIRFLAMDMFKELALGIPVVPDLRPLIDEYMQELCLPNDMKPLVHSLMHFRSFDFLDVHVHGKIPMPSYELFVMSHILCAIKICFGLDGEYDNRLSDAVDKINEIENHPKSYNSEPTERLFSFCEWSKYLQFRKSQLWTHTLHLGAPNYLDMNDYVAFEHLSEKPDYKITLKDRIARDIINKLPESDLNVIPISEFPPTTTPYTTYTRVVMEHTQEPLVKKLLSEDFTQYSLKYIFDDMFLVDPDSENPKNVVTGVSAKNFIESLGYFEILEQGFEKVRSKGEMIYVRDCDNHNWMTTHRPQEEHIVTIKNNSYSHPSMENSSDSNLDSKDNTVITVDSKVDLSSVTNTMLNGKLEKDDLSDSKESSITEDSKVFEVNRVTDIEIDIHKDKLSNDVDLIIREEAEEENIFDDVFDFETKKEVDEEPEFDEPELPCAENNNALDLPDILRYDGLTQEYRTGRDSEESSDDSIHITPETLDRKGAIKELVIHACNKYKISIPGKYICRQKPNYVRKNKYEPNVERPRGGMRTQAIKSIIAEYHSHIQQDLFVQISSMVQSAIADFNVTKQDTLMEVDESPINNEPLVNNETLNQSTEIEPNDSITEQELISVSKADIDKYDDKYNLFDDESDGETNAEELLPKKNPEFDEKTHDISQLYIKPVEDAGVAEMALNPNLLKIIDQKIGEEKEDKPPASPEVEKKSDSEDGIPLSTVQELKRLRESVRKGRSNQIKPNMRARLIKANIPIPNYNYWVRCYKKSRYSNNRPFAKELRSKMPNSFVTILVECADVVGYPPFNLYSSLQRVEKCLVDKFARKKIFTPLYFEREIKRVRTSGLGSY